MKRFLLSGAITMQVLRSVAQLFSPDQVEISQNNISVIKELQICPSGKKDSLMTEFFYNQYGLLKMKKIGITTEH